MRRPIEPYPTINTRAPSRSSNGIWSGGVVSALPSVSQWPSRERGEELREAATHRDEHPHGPLGHGDVVHAARVAERHTVGHVRQHHLDACIECLDHLQLRELAEAGHEVPELGAEHEELGGEVVGGRLSALVQETQLESGGQRTEFVE